MSYIFWKLLFQRIILAIKKHFFSILRGVRFLLTQWDRRRRQNHQQKLSVAICWCYQKPSRGLQKWAAECWFSCEPDGDALTTGQVGKINRQSIHRTKWVRLCRAFSSLVLKIEQLQGWDTGLMEYVTVQLIYLFRGGRAMTKYRIILHHTSSFYKSTLAFLLWSWKGIPFKQHDHDK